MVDRNINLTGIPGVNTLQIPPAFHPPPPPQSAHVPSPRARRSPCLLRLVLLLHGEHMNGAVVTGDAQQGRVVVEVDAAEGERWYTVTVSIHMQRTQRQLATQLLLHGHWTSGQALW